MDHVNGSKSLWDEAYNEVCKSHKGLMGWFEETLCSLQRPVQGATVDNQGQERQRNIQQLAKEKSMILGENRTRFSCWGHDIIIRDRFKTAIDLMLKFKGIVDIAVQANSAAALAWSGGVVILQVSLLAFERSCQIEPRSLPVQATHNVVHSSFETLFSTTKTPWKDY